MNPLVFPALLFGYFFPGKRSDLSFGLLKKLGIDDDLRKRNWKSMENKILLLSEEGELNMVIDGISRNHLYDEILEEYLREPVSEVQNLIAGQYYTSIGWKTRSYGLAKDVNKDQWEGFVNHLQNAHNCLNTPFTSQLFQIQALASLINIYRGVGEKALAREAYEICMQLSPNHVTANMTYFKVLTPRWMGSKEEMKDLCNSKSGGIKTLLTLMYLTDTFEDLLSEYPHTAVKTHYKLEYTHFLENLEYSTDNGILSIYIRNHLANLYNILGLKKERNLLLKSLKGQFSNTPWEYNGMLNERQIKLYKLGGLLLDIY